MTIDLQKYLNAARASLPVLEKVAEVALTIAKLIPVTAPIANAIEMGIKIERGLAAEIPLVIQTYNDMKDAAAGGKEVTPDQWAAWEAQIDAAHDELQAAAQAVLDGPGK